MPPAKEGFVQTLNQMGFMTTGLDPISRAFVDFAERASGPLLDVGAAYGVATVPALEKGATVIANDIDERHLEILRERVSNKHRDRLLLAPGAFPGKLEFTENSLGGVLICRVLHFFSGEEIERGTRKLFAWLKPGAKAFVVAETPYIQTLKALIPAYELRKANGEAWPGYFDSIHATNPDLAEVLPNQMHLLDPEVLSRVFTEKGFEIETAQLLDRKDFPSWLRLDGRESVGLIARKP